MSKIDIGDTVEWPGDAVGGSNQGMVLDRDSTGMGTPVLWVRIKGGRMARLPEKLCKKVVKR